MIKGKLITRDGGFVTDFFMPPFQLLPEVALWGSRVFVIDKPFEQKFGEPAEPIYREACGWSVDAAKALAEQGLVGPYLPGAVKPEVEPLPAAGIDVHGKPKATLSGLPPADGKWDGPAPQPIDPATGMHKDYYVLPESERKKGFIRPLRRSYKHEKCGGVTTMGLALCETYARDPKYYGSTFCATCSSHFPVGEFKWKEDGQVVGS